MMTRSIILFQAILLSIIQQSIEESSFRPGVVYQYRYEGQIVTGLSQTSAPQQFSGLKLNCRCVLQLQASHVAVLQLRDIRLFKLNEKLDVDASHDLIPETHLNTLVGDQADLLVEQFSKPISFRYLSGEITDVRGLRSDPYWSVNIKKGIISLFHLNLRPKNGEQESRVYHRTRYGMSPVLSSFNVLEADPSGNCDTRYVISTEDSQMMGSASKLHVSKVKNFQECSGTHSFAQGLFSGFENYGSSEQEVIERTVHTDYTLRGDRQNFLIETSQLKAQYSLKLGDYQPTTNIIQRLSLMNTNPLHYPTRIDSSYVPDSHGLALNIPKSSLTPEVDPLAGREHYADIIEVKLSKLVELIQPVPNEQCLRKFVELHQVLGDVDSAQLLRIILSYIVNPTQPNSKQKSEILLSILPTLPSSDVALVITSLIKSRHVDDVIAESLLKTMSFIIKPNQNTIQEFMKLLEDLPRNSTLRSTLLPAIGTLTNRLYHLMPRPPKTQLVFFIESVSNKFQKYLRQAADEEEQLIVVSAMSNLGLLSLVQPLRLIIENQQQPIRLRVEAIRALTKAAQLGENPVHPLLLGLYMDRDERVELRREAVRVLLSSSPSESSLQLIAHSLHTESNDQMKTLVYSYIKNLANGPTSTEGQRKLVTISKSVQNVMRPVTVGWDDSQQYQTFFSSEKKNIEGRIKLEHTKSSDDHLLPDNIQASAELKILGRNINLAGFSLELKNYEKIVKEILQYGKLLNLPNILHSARTIRSEGSVDLLRSFTSMIQRKLSSGNSAFQSHLSLNFLNQRIKLKSLKVNSSSVEDVVTDVTTTLRGLLSRLAEGVDINESKTIALVGNSFILPTPFGTTLAVNISTVAALTVKGQVKVENFPLFDENPQQISEQNPSVKINVTPSMTALLLGHMGTDMRWLLSGAGFKSTLSAKLPINIGMSVDKASNRFTFTHDLNQEKYPSVEWKQIPFTYIHNVPKTIDRLPYIVELKPVMPTPHLISESMFRWSGDLLGTTLLINGSEWKSLMASVRPSDGEPLQIFIEGSLIGHHNSLELENIRSDQQEDYFWNIFSESDRRRRGTGRQRVLLRTGTRRLDGSNSVTKFEITLSKSLKGRTLINFIAAENTEGESAGQMLVLSASLSSSSSLAGVNRYMYQVENSDLSFITLNISWIDWNEATSLNSTVQLTCWENLAESQIQNDLRALKMSPALTDMINKCALKLSFSEITPPIQEYIMTVRDAVKYRFYPNVRVNMPLTPGSNSVTIRTYYDPSSMTAGTVIDTPGETDYIQSSAVPDWLSAVINRLEQDDTERIRPVTVPPVDSSYDCNYRCDTKRSYVCGTDGNTYLNFCDLRQSACRSREVINVLHDGRCTSGGFSMFEEIRDPGARVRAVCDHGCKLTEIDTNISAVKYFRSGKEMLRMAEVYLDEGSYEKAFILYSKFATLFIEKLPKHPDYKSVPADTKTTNKKMLNLALAKAEAIKKKLTEIYSKEEQMRIEEEEKQAREVAAEMERLRLVEEKKEKEKEKIKQDELKYRAEQERRILQESEQQLRKLKDKARNAAAASAIAATAPLMPYDGSQISAANNLPNVSPSHQPTAPPPAYNSVVPRPEVPSRSLKPATNSTISSRPRMDHFTNVGETDFKTIFIPDPLVRHFLTLAAPNTAKSVETCAILCGKLARGSWYITHLLMPHQHGTSDSCDITNEEDLAEYQDEHSLITLGWIHTHPTQTAFLSSVDLHTHWPFQKLLPEAIAIVCSPKYQETGFFCLTPEGMDCIGSCRGRGFHEHPKHLTLFETCRHVQVDSSASINVVDMRK